ncbi:zinc finger CCCH domain-containing protein 48-like isoform X2 [Fagus crenata]
MTLNGHDDVVKSLLCWDQHLLSCSLDCTLKVWSATKEDSLEVIYTHSEEHGVLALGGMTDSDVKPIVYCSCGDNSVHIYELPSSWGPLFHWGSDWFADSVEIASRTPGCPES